MKKTISSTGAPKAIGPYSQAVKSAGFLFISGQIPINAETGIMPNTIAAQTEQSLGNIAAILAEAAYCRDDLVKATIFFKNLSDFDEVNKIYAAFFADCSFPARSTIEVAALPRNALIEIEVLAYREPS
jgi:2-iminobutanoate/2-iminopropanoate deaminase